MLLVSPGCGSNSPSTADPTSDVKSAAATEREIVLFCGGCHEPPRSSSFPKDAWEEEVDQGFDLFHDSDRTDLKPPRPASVVLDYYLRDAPDEFVFPKIEYAKGGLPVQFDQTGLILLPETDPPVISHLRWSPKTAAHGPGLLACDMENGRLIWTDPAHPETPPLVLETFRNPASVNVVDLNKDGTLEYVVGDLGSFKPADHGRGKVYLLHLNAETGVWTKQMLVRGVGRVVDVETGDFDGDGDPDLVVSAFGWRKTGNVLLLRNESTEANPFSFVKEEIDPRAGAIQVQKCDFNSDGKLDFVTVFSQQHEKVIAFINQGDGKFLPETVFNAGFPSYGSSGIELVDMDLDGDDDVLYTNGDSFDDFLTKPYHSVQWLENEQRYPFTRHELTKMPGVHRALAGDIDGDQDMDVVAVGMLPPESRNPEINNELDSIVLLEQVEGGKFVRHSLEKRSLHHATCELGDFDGDDDLDIAVGVFMQKDNEVRIEMFWNQLKP